MQAGHRPGLFDKRIKKQSQKQIFPWLNLLYSRYEIADETNANNVLSKVKIHSKQSKFTKYFLYFYYAVYREKSLQLYERYHLQQKMSFEFECRIVNKNYPQSEQLCNFYLEVNLLFAIDNSFLYSPEELNNLINFNIGCQSFDKLYGLLLKVGKSSPKLLVNFDQDILKLFVQEKSLSVEQFFKLKTMYWPPVFERRHQSGHQVKVLMEFIKELIYLSESRAHSTHPQIKQQISILMASSTLSSRFPEFDIPKFYSKCKILKAVSKNSIDLLSGATQIFQGRIKELIKAHPIKVVLSLLIQPINQFDRIQLNELFAQRKISTADLIEVIREIVGNERNDYDIEYLEQKFTEINREIEINLIAELLDKLMTVMKHKGSKSSQARVTLIHRLFTIFISQTKITDCTVLKKLLQSNCKLRDEFLKEAYLNKIFTQINHSPSSQLFLQFAQTSASTFQTSFKQSCEPYFLACRNVSKPQE